MRAICSTNEASMSARSDGARPAQAWKPERETPRTRHMSEIEWLALSAAMNRNTLTASRSPSRRRPLLFSGSPALARAAAPADAAPAAPHAHPPSGRRARPVRSAPAAPTAAATPSKHRDRGRARRACDRSGSRAPPPRGETPADTAFGTSASLAWPDSLSAGPDSPALSCPRKRGHSNDATRLACARIYPDESADSALAFLAELERFYAEHGIEVERILSDNGTCFKRRWAEGCARLGIGVRKTRPYRPQTNGKVERFIRRLLELWAYAYPYEHERDRAAALAPALESYNRFRPHRALDGLTPLQRVNNLSGTNT